MDGILLHQILQWHHMLTSEGSYPKTTVAGLETNTLGDGLFHRYLGRGRRRHLHPLATNDGLAVGDQRTRVCRLVAGRLGSLQLVEGVVDHHILTLHHVREGSNETAWDLAFLAFGALLVIGGWLLARTELLGRRAEA